MDIGQIIRCHQQGDLAQAEAGYRDFLAAMPGHLQALQMLSLLLMQTRVPLKPPTISSTWWRLSRTIRIKGPILPAC